MLVMAGKFVIRRVLNYILTCPMGIHYYLKHGGVVMAFDFKKEYKEFYMPKRNGNTDLTPPGGSR